MSSTFSSTGSGRGHGSVCGEAGRGSARTATNTNSNIRGCDIISSIGSSRSPRFPARARSIAWLLRSFSSPEESAAKKRETMPDTKLVGQNYTPPDLVAKVTGRAKYAEDYRVDGMLFAKLLLSPMPHARGGRIDTRAALAIPGVKAILTADDLPDLHGAERALTNEPLYQGEPILAIAAVDERPAAEAIERIPLDLEPLPFVTDPVESLRPGSANARLDGNVWITPAPSARAAGAPPTPAAPKVQVLKWTA